jgi:hypothetical protein
MPKLTKKAIREALRAVRRERAGRIQNVLGYRMYWLKLMKPQGVPGYAWNPIIVIEKFVHMPGRTDGPFNWSGTLDSAVDVLHARHQG